MAFRVELAPQAFDDLDSIATYIRSRTSFAMAERWFNGIIDDIASLSEMPERCFRASESDILGTEIRLLLHGKRNRRYKIYFAIEEQTRTVNIFHIRHWAMRPADADELGDLLGEESGAGKGPDVGT